MRVRFTLENGTQRICGLTEKEYRGLIRGDEPFHGIRWLTLPDGSTLSYDHIVLIEKLDEQG